MKFHTQARYPGLPRWRSDKEPTCNAGGSGDAGSIPGSGGSPGGEHGNPTPVFLPGESHGQRNLAGCPWGLEASDTTEAIARTRAPPTQLLCEARTEHARPTRPPPPGGRACRSLLPLVHSPPPRPARLVQGAGLGSPCYSSFPLSILY